MSTHLAIKDISRTITKESIIEKATIFHQTLKRDFRISNPRIAVLALNPHAGDDGLLGSEEKDVIIPAIDELAEKGIQAFGPYPADGFFGSGNYYHFDGVLAMYHDQGLAPFKTIAIDSGINYTAGLPIIRTSPDHGTAYDIAGQGKADENSMRQAVYTAIDVFRNRQNYDEPLKSAKTAKKPALPFARRISSARTSLSRKVERKPLKKGRRTMTERAKRRQKVKFLPKCAIMSDFLCTFAAKMAKKG